MAKKTDGRVDLVDAASLHFALESLEESTGKSPIRLNFKALDEVMTECRREVGWSPRALALAYAAIDPSNEAQRRFGQRWEEAGFRFVGIDYRDCFPSVPAGRSPTDQRDRLISSMVPQVSYALGTMRLFSSPDIVVVSHAFDLSGPLLELASHGARVCLTYFRSLLDQRWERRVKLFDKASVIKFFDLEPYSKTLIDIDLGSSNGPGLPKGSQIGF